ncbi:metallo-beta-lactamase superfamily protein [mine drainage metagenome]|uniref:Metallo-beta-lactamase superfamily protein n=1 Tax=mine drainage metagenome TaxID=410659 RepID=A0A1J5RS36_9ZZZZ
MTTLRILCENTARGMGVLGEHGLAWWIDTGAHRVLFDAGQGLALDSNARRLGVDLANADAIVLSHGHADHVGGLQQALDAAPGASLLLHPDAVARRFTGSDGGAKGRRLSVDFLESRRFVSGSRRVILTREPTEVVPGLWCTGEIPRTNDFEDVGGPFYLDEELTRPDPILDDQALYFESRDGVVVILGCAHAGVVNTLDHVRMLTRGAPLHAVLGGMHLERADARRLDETFAALRRLGVRRFGPNHCTGIGAVARFWSEFPGRCVQCAAGVRLEFP